MQQPLTEFDRYSSNYTEAVDASIAFSGLRVDFFIRAKAERLLELLQAHFGRTDALSLLDVGCGVGAYHGVLRSKIGVLTGVDVSVDSLCRAKESNPDVRYHHYDGLRLPFEDACFDVAYAICVVHHVPEHNWQAFVDELARVVRPGGLVVLFEHNPRNPATRYAVWSCPFDDDAVLLSRGRSLSLLRGAGLASVRGRFLLALPATKGCLRRIDDLLAVIPLGAQYYALGMRR